MLINWVALVSEEPGCQEVHRLAMCGIHLKWSGRLREVHTLYDIQEHSIEVCMVEVMYSYSTSIINERYGGRGMAVCRGMVVEVWQYVEVWW